MTFRWTLPRVADLRKFYIDEGRSAAETARAIGHGCTRSAVIGKAHRMGWMKSNRRPPATMDQVKAKVSAMGNRAAPPKPGPQRKAAVIIGRITDDKPEVAERRATDAAAAGAKMIDKFTEAANDTAIPLLNRRAFQCSWPVGIPSRPAEQLCCGLPVAMEANKAVATYCTRHAAKAVARVLAGGKPDAKTYERAMRRWVDA